MLCTCLTAGSLCFQANVDRTKDPKEWDLGPLANKMKQYCYLLSDLDAKMIEEQAGGDYKQLNDYLRRRAVDAYWQKVHLISTSISFSVCIY